MMKLKRLFLVVVSVVMLTGVLTGCGKKDEGAKTYEKENNIEGIANSNQNKVNTDEIIKAEIEKKEFLKKNDINESDIVIFEQRVIKNEENPIYIVSVAYQPENQQSNSKVFQVVYKDGNIDFDVIREHKYLSDKFEYASNEKILRLTAEYRNSTTQNYYQLKNGKFYEITDDVEPSRYNFVELKATEIAYNKKDNNNNNQSNSNSAKQSNSTINTEAYGSETEGDIGDYQYLAYMKINKCLKDSNWVKNNISSVNAENKFIKLSNINDSPAYIVDSNENGKHTIALVFFYGSDVVVKKKEISTVHKNITVDTKNNVLILGDLKKYFENNGEIDDPVSLNTIDMNGFNEFAQCTDGGVPIYYGEALSYGSFKQRVESIEGIFIEWNLNDSNVDKYVKF